MRFFFQKWLSPPWFSPNGNIELKFERNAFNRLWDNCDTDCEWRRQTMDTRWMTCWSPIPWTLLTESSRAEKLKCSCSIKDCKLFKHELPWAKVMYCAPVWTFIQKTHETLLCKRCYPLDIFISVDTARTMMFGLLARNYIQTHSIFGQTNSSLCGPTSI